MLNTYKKLIFGKPGLERMNDKHRQTMSNRFDNKDKKFDGNMIKICLKYPNTSLKHP